MAYKFLVTSGMHIDEQNNRHRKGETFESDNELDKIPAFKDRLIRVNEHDNEIDLGPGAMAPEEAKGASARAEAERLRQLPKVVEDQMHGLNSAKPKAQMDADKAGHPLNKDEQERLGDKTKATKKQKATDDEDEEKDTKSPAQARAQKLGDDVTHKYPTAKKKGLTVHLTEEGDYQIAKKGQIVKGGETLRKSQISKFVKKQGK